LLHDIPHLVNRFIGVNRPGTRGREGQVSGSPMTVLSPVEQSGNHARFSFAVGSISGRRASSKHLKSVIA
jgi:hypothetical protein